MSWVWQLLHIWQNTNWLNRATWEFLWWWQLLPQEWWWGFITALMTIVTARTRMMMIIYNGFDDEKTGLARGTWCPCHITGRSAKTWITSPLALFCLIYTIHCSQYNTLIFTAVHSAFCLCIFCTVTCGSKKFTSSIWQSERSTVFFHTLQFNASYHKIQMLFTVMECRKLSVLQIKS